MSTAVLIALAIVGAVGVGLALLGRRKPSGHGSQGNGREDYKAFDGKRYALVRERRGPIVLLSPDPLSGEIAERLFTAWTVAHAHYTDQCAVRRPTVTIAVVDSTCGAGCGQLGGDHIEILRSAWDEILTEAEGGQANHIVLYELGRVFWTLNERLAALGGGGAIATGFAVYHRQCIARQLWMAPFNGIEWPEFDRQIRGLVAAYKADATLNWGNTIGAGKGVPGAWGATDLFASILMDLDEHCGPQDIWKNAARRPVATTATEAARNLAAACSPDAAAYLREALKLPA